MFLAGLFLGALCGIFIVGLVINNQRNADRKAVYDETYWQVRFNAASYDHEFERRYVNARHRADGARYRLKQGDRIIGSTQKKARECAEKCVLQSQLPG